MVHPDQSEQVPAMIERYRSTIEAGNGPFIVWKTGAAVSWPFLSPSCYKAHYVLMNVECNGEAMAEMESAFRFNDAVIRNLVLQKKEAVTEASPLAKVREKDEGDPRESRDGESKPRS